MALILVEPLTNALHIVGLISDMCDATGLIYGAGPAVCCRGLGRFPYGIFIITARIDMGQRIFEELARGQSPILKAIFSQSILIPIK